MRPVTRISAYHWYLASPYWKGTPQSGAQARKLSVPELRAARDAGAPSDLCGRVQRVAE